MGESSYETTPKSFEDGNHIWVHSEKSIVLWWGV